MNTDAPFTVLPFRMLRLWTKPVPIKIVIAADVTDDSFPYRPAFWTETCGRTGYANVIARRDVPRLAEISPEGDRYL